MSKERNIFVKKVEDWGKTKFKPTLKATTTRISENPFTKPQNFNTTGDNQVGNFNDIGFTARPNRGGKFSGNNRGGGGRFNSRGGGKFNGTRHFGRNNRDAGKYQTDKNDRVRFNPITRDAKPDIATPWTKFKDEINHKQREETQAAAQANMDTEEAKVILKQREINYRKLLMEQKKQEVLHWEDFGENEPNEADNGKTNNSKQYPTPKEKLYASPENVESNKKNTKKYKAEASNKTKNRTAENKRELEAEDAGYQGKIKRKEINMKLLSDTPENEENSNNTKKNNKKKKQCPKEQQLNIIVPEMDNDNGTIGIESKRRQTQMENDERSETTDDGRNRKALKKMHAVQKKNENGGNSNKNTKKPKLFLSNEELGNFNADNLSFQQKDALRRIITKGVVFKMGTSLEQCLKNRKYQKACKEKKNKSNK